MITSSVSPSRFAAVVVCGAACALPAFGAPAQPAAAPPAPTAAPAAAPKVTTGYHLANHIALPGDSFWDYLAADADGRRVYVSHGDRVVVLDADRLAQVAEITGLSGVHGIALAPGLDRGYISNGKSGAITVFDLAKSSKVAEWKSTGENPDAILFDPATKRVFAFNGRSKNATVFDATTGAVVATLDLGGKPEFASADGKGKVYVNIEDTSEIAILDAGKPAVLSRHPLAPCEEPSGQAIDRKNLRLWIACGNKLAAVVDASNGKVLATLPSGDGSDAAAFDPGTGNGFTSNGEGTVSVFGEVSAGHFGLIENVPTQKGARTMTLDEKTHRIYLSTAEFGQPPAATPDNPRPRPTLKPGSFTVLVLERP
jgi:DNA-binding beta-propeller fold protein YncE